MNDFWGMKVCGYFGGGGDHKIGLHFGVISMHFGDFKVQNGGYFWGLVKFQIFFGCLKFLILSLGGR